MSVKLRALFLVNALMPASVVAQSRGLEFQAGQWWYANAENSAVYSVMSYQPLFGPVSWGLGATLIRDGTVGPLMQDRTSSGGTVALSIGQTTGLSVRGGTGIVVRHEGGGIDAFWNAGAAYTIRPFRFLQLGVDASYRVEDADGNGFWRLRPQDRRGLALSVGISIGGGSRRVAAPRPSPPPGANPNTRPPREEDVFDSAREGGASRDAAALSAAVVQKAIDVMGTPYEWGGNDENGFDCSGLIKYAYESQGIIVPRISRDQARFGSPIERTISKLRPGDILGFSIEGDRVTHVGLYIGDGRFIHSASGGVKISVLGGTDGDSTWWSRRWLATRRVIS